MNNYEKQYLDLLRKIKYTGVRSKNRTGIDTIKIWGAQINIDLQEGFPLLTTKKMHLKSLVHELLWMIKGDTNIQYLLKNGVTFWTEWPYKKYLESDNDPNGTSNCSCDSMTFSQKDFEQTIINNDIFAKKWGSIGKYGYGALWREFPHRVSPIGYNRGDYFEARGWSVETVDQLTNVINDLKTNPDSRRIIISVWHPYHSNNKEDALLPACHNYIQFGTEELTLEERWNLLNIYNKNPDGSPKDLFIKTDITDNPVGFSNSCSDIGVPTHRLNCYYSMRSNDFFLGNPYNNAFYALFTHLIANQLNMIPGQLVFSGADVHLYSNHLEQTELQLSRTPKTLPTLNIKTPGKSIFDITYDDIEIKNYDAYPSIKADVAV